MEKKDVIKFDVSHEGLGRKCGISTARKFSGTLLTTDFQQHKKNKNKWETDFSYLVAKSYGLRGDQ